METLGVTWPAYVVLTGAEGERQVPLEDGSIWRIGRSDQNQIVVRHDLVSRNHAMIQRTESGEFFLIDLGSRNGSFVNGTRVSIPAPLHDGDVIALGDYQLLFHQDSRPIPTADVQAEEEGGATKPLYVTRLITVLVVDIRDFTGFSQRVSEALLCQTVGTWFNQASTIMGQHGSWAQKFIGDAVMAVWQHRDRAKESDEIARVLKALAAFVKLTEGLPGQLGLPAPLRIGAGINTGLASMGNTGSGIVTDYTALGSTVNVAFRLESATKELACDLAMGEGTFTRLNRHPNSPEYFEERSAALKGFEGETKVFATSFDRLLRLADTL